MQAQADTAALPCGALALPGQLVQSDSEVAPTVAWYLPAWQLSHAVLTPAALNLPGTQLSHAILTPAAALNLPASQLSQALLPSVVWCLPAGQSVQVPLPAYTYLRRQVFGVV